MAKESDNLILRQETYSPLTTKGSTLTSAEFDENNINIYKDIVAMCVTLGVDAYSASVTYDDTTVQFATYSGLLWQWINAAPGSGQTPAESSYWQSVFPAILAHRKNSDTILAEGTGNEVTAAEIRAYIDAGLSATTNLTIGTHTANTLLLESSTGADVTIPEATASLAGLLNAADKAVLAQTSGRNTGDQSLSSLGAEALVNKATSFGVLNNTLYPSVQAVETRIVAETATIVGAATAAADTLEKIEALIDASYLEVEVSNAEALALFTTPKAVLGAPGANKYYKYRAVLENQFVSVAFTAADQFYLYQGAKQAYFPLTVVTNAADAFAQETHTGICTSNAPLTLRTDSNPTLGDGGFKLKIWYTIQTA